MKWSLRKQNLEGRMYAYCCTDRSDIKIFRDTKLNPGSYTYVLSINGQEEAFKTLKEAQLTAQTREANSISEGA